MGIDIVIRFVASDLAIAQRVADALGEAGHAVLCLPDTDDQPGADKPVKVVLWTAQSVLSSRLLRWALAARAPIELSLDAAEPKLGFRSATPIALHGPAAGFTLVGPALEQLRAAVRTALTVHGHPAPTGPSSSVGQLPRPDLASAADPLASWLWLASPSAATPRPAMPAAAAPRPTFDAGDEDLLFALPSAFSLRVPASPAEDPKSPLHATAAPVLLAASAPRSCAAGSSFTACLVAYIEATRESALRRLEQFGEAGDRVVSDLAPDGDARWRVGAPITVRAAGPHLTVTPAERRFDWNGRENAAAFAVAVDAAAPTGSVELCFAVDVAGVTMAFIPMRLAVGSAPTSSEAALPPTEVTAPRSVFASYSSKDAQAVTGRLSTLLRWSPGLDIFQDCLDLVPNEAFKPQLAAQIKARDAFVLFWSRHAAASPWVRWEYETARDGKGLATILPMPLEDPALAPPPAEFADAHWRDRFMLAGYALAKIRDEVVKP